MLVQQRTPRGRNCGTNPGTLGLNSFRHPTTLHLRIGLCFVRILPFKCKNAMLAAGYHLHPHPAAAERQCLWFPPAVWFRACCYTCDFPPCPSMRFRGPRQGRVGCPVCAHWRQSSLQVGLGVSCMLHQMQLSGRGTVEGIDVLCAPSLPASATNHPLLVGELSSFVYTMDVVASN